MFLFVGLVSDELMLKIIQSELDKLHGKASSPPPAPFYLYPLHGTPLIVPDNTSHIANPKPIPLSPSNKTDRAGS